MLLGNTLEIKGNAKEAIIRLNGNDLKNIADLKLQCTGDAMTAIISLNLDEILIDVEPNTVIDRRFAKVEIPKGVDIEVFGRVMGASIKQLKIEADKQLKQEALKNG